MLLEKACTSKRFPCDPLVRRCNDSGRAHNTSTVLLKICFRYRHDWKYLVSSFNKYTNSPFVLFFVAFIATIENDETI